AEAEKPEVEAASTVGEIDWKEYAENYSNDIHGSTGHGSGGDDDDRRAALENVLVKRTLLPDHLMWQLRLSDLSDQEKEVGALIIGSLDKDGYLPLQLEEVAFLADTWPDVEIVERVLGRLQEFDPPGVAARGLAECLLIQLRQLGVADDALPARIVRDYLPMLESRRFDRLARELGVPIEQIAEATKVISVLEPKPGRDFGDSDTRYVTPDVYVQKVGDDYVVTLNEEGLPRLRVSSFYRRMLGQNGSPEARGYIQEKMRAAAWLIKSIHQRQRTLYMVTSSIVKFQSDFLEGGVAFLRPLVLKDVANDIGMHESTVSRATAGDAARAFPAEEGPSSRSRGRCHADHGYLPARRSDPAPQGLRRGEAPAGPEVPPPPGRRARDPLRVEGAARRRDHPQGRPRHHVRRGGDPRPLLGDRPRHRQARAPGAEAPREAPAPQGRGGGARRVGGDDLGAGRGSAAAGRRARGDPHPACAGQAARGRGGGR